MKQSKEKTRYNLTSYYPNAVLHQASKTTGGFGHKEDNSPLKNSEHCNGYGTACCLGCDKCWGRKYATKRQG